MKDQDLILQEVTKLILITMRASQQEVRSMEETESLHEAKSCIIKLHEALGKPKPFFVMKHCWTYSGIYSTICDVFETYPSVYDKISEFFTTDLCLNVDSNNSKYIYKLLDFFDSHKSINDFTYFLYHTAISEKQDNHYRFYFKNRFNFKI